MRINPHSWFSTGKQKQLNDIVLKQEKLERQLRSLENKIEKQSIHKQEGEK